MVIRKQKLDSQRKCGAGLHFVSGVRRVVVVDRRRRSGDLLRKMLVIAPVKQMSRAAALDLT